MCYFPNTFNKQIFRFGADATACPFRCGHGNDKLAHIACCNAFWHCFCSTLGTANFCLGLDDALLMRNDQFDLADDASLIFLLGLHVCFLTFNALRHGAQFSPAHIRHCIRLIGFGSIVTADCRARVACTGNERRTARCEAGEGRGTEPL